jgi:hypothetical protein
VVPSKRLHLSRAKADLKNSYIWGQVFLDFENMKKAKKLLPLVAFRMIGRGCNWKGASKEL